MIGVLLATVLSSLLAFGPPAAVPAGTDRGAERGTSGAIDSAASPDAAGSASSAGSRDAPATGPSISELLEALPVEVQERILAEAAAALPMSPVSMVNRAAIVLLVAFLITLFGTPLARRLALRRGIVDRPDGGRKIHREPIPYLGGLAVFAGIFIALLIAPWLTGLQLGYVVTPVGVVVGLVAIMLAGLGDDVGGWDPRTKIAGQLVAAAGLAISEIGIEASRGALNPVFEWLRGARDADATLFAFLGEEVSWRGIYDAVSYWGGVLLIAIFVLGFTNATNFIDGLDGLCSGTVGIFAVGILIVSLLLVPLGTNAVSPEGRPAFDPASTAYVDLSSDAEDRDEQIEQALGEALAGPWNTPEAIPAVLEFRDEHPMVVARVVLAMALLGAVLGFLPWNFNPAVIFLGDCGSLMLGYVCAVLILMLGDAGRTDFVLAGLIIFALPIMDLMLAIVRRRLAGVSMTAADSEHLHHQVRRAFGSVRKAVLALYGVAILFAALGSGLVALVMNDVQARVIYAVAIILFGFIGVLALKAARHRAGARAAAV